MLWTAPLLLVISLFFVGASTFFIRSHIPSDKSCNHTAGHECFALIFSRISAICTSEPLQFKCIHYNFLDHCFNQRVGYCTTNQISTFARVGFNEAQRKCSEFHPKTYREVIPTRDISRQFGDSRRRVPDSQFIATLGYLQTQCSATQNTSCAADQMENIFENCEHEIRTKTASAPKDNDFDLHKLFRIKLDTSRRLLTFQETEKNYECLMVKWALNKIYDIHTQHCFHTIMTRCLCERGEFEKHCGVKCADLEVHPLKISEEEWEELRSRLHHGRGIHKTIPILLILICLSTIFFQAFGEHQW
ncbi:unnamed protein product, partial [Mesorhabditis spiculigera]